MITIDVEKSVRIDPIFLDKYLKKKYPDDYVSLSTHNGNPKYGLLPYMEAKFQEGANVSEIQNILDSLENPSLNISNLSIDMNQGPLAPIDNDSIVADASKVKKIRIELAMDEITKSLEMIVYEKFEDGDYGDLPAGKISMKVLGEYSLEANGTQLVEV